MMTSEEARKMASRAIERLRYLYRRGYLEESEYTAILTRIATANDSLVDYIVAHSDGSNTCN